MTSAITTGFGPNVAGEVFFLSTDLEEGESDIITHDIPFGASIVGYDVLCIAGGGSVEMCLSKEPTPQLALDVTDRTNYLVFLSEYLRVSERASGNIKPMEVQDYHTLQYRVLGGDTIDVSFEVMVYYLKPLK